jgi:hypothetical protein
LYGETYLIKLPDLKSKQRIDAFNEPVGFSCSVNYLFKGNKQ